MDGPWLNDLTARDNRYKFNGIERIQDNGLNMDLAPFRSYDPAIGRWWQADPIAKAWESPYVAMYNSPLNWADGMGDDRTSNALQIQI
jgi:RHS repeat-associated protein